MTAIKLAPSILAADFACLREQVAEVERAGADRIHVDVMDGHFVPNISMGPVVVKALRRVTRLPLEVHLMISEPDRYIEAFAQAGADTLEDHVEIAAPVARTIERIKGLGKKAGVVVKPATPASAVSELLPAVDIVLVMTVEPGFGGQAFMADMMPKVQQLREMIDRVRPEVELEVDGGIDPETAPQALRAGARVFVAGSSIFGAKDGVAAAMQRLRDAMA
jgi:ribulose-phosphate 3-epimerase